MACLEAWGQLLRVGSLLPTCGFCGLNSGSIGKCTALGEGGLRGFFFLCFYLDLLVLTATLFVELKPLICSFIN